MGLPLDTMKVVSKKDKDGYVIINTRDFNPKKHKIYDPDAPVEHQKPVAPKPVLGTRSRKAV